MIDISKYGRALKKGAIVTLAPSVLKGSLVEFFNEKGVNTEIVIEWVLLNQSLWDSFDPERKSQMRHLAGKLGDISWMTAGWVIESLRKEHPAVASLFLGWKKGENWLVRQIEEIKQELQSP